jgi:PIN domain nuclease of toxin-antitoxin system
VRLLLDSHILLWLDSNPSLVPGFQLDVLADVTNEVLVSAVTAWELGIKQSKGKLVLSRPVSEQRVWFGFLELPITFAHAEFAAQLPQLHGDPFDRMLVAQAMVEGLTLVTADAAVRAYGVACL